MGFFSKSESSSRPRFTSAAYGTTATLWIVILTLASTGTTVALACATPFTALAALAATQMRGRDGIPLMVVAWAASQLVGFGLHDYPRDTTTLAWAVALCMAAVVCVIAARQVTVRMPNSSALSRIIVAYLVASVTFKAVILLWSFGLGGVDTALSPSINARQLVRNGAILVALYGFCRALIAIGMPGIPRDRDNSGTSRSVVLC